MSSTFNKEKQAINQKIDHADDLINELTERIATTHLDENGTETHPMKNKLKKKKKKIKREIFKSTEPEQKPINICSNKDPEFYPKRIIDGTYIDQCLFQRFKDILSSSRIEQFLCISELLRYNNGEISLEDCNERLYEIEKDFIKNYGKKSNSCFTSNDPDKYPIWFNLRSRPLDKNQNETPLLDNKYLENAITALLKEAEEAGMVVKVFLCEGCELGTSYCADVLDKQTGIWLCNYCKHENDSRSNRYYLYNKIQFGLSSYLRYGSATFLTQVYNNIFQHKTPLKGKKLNYSESVGISNFRYLELKGTAYSSNIEAHPVMRSLSSGKVEVRKDRGYSSNFVHETINVLLCCEEVPFDDKSVYLFYLRPYQLPGSRHGLCSDIYRLMVLPIVDHFKSELYPIDELLAVMYDELNNLTFCGIKIKDAVAGNFFHINLLNFCAKDDIQKLFKSRVVKTKLTHLANKEQKLVPDFGGILFGIIGRCALEQYWKVITPRAKILFEEEVSKSLMPLHSGVFKNHEEFVKLHEYISCKLELPDNFQEISIEELPTQTVSYYLWVLITTHVKDLKESIPPILLRLMNEVKKFFDDSNLKQHGKNMKKSFEKLLDSYTETCKLYGLAPSEKIYDLIDCIYSMNYFGDVEALNSEWLWESEKAHFKNAYTYKKHLNILNSLNKSHALFANYMCMIQRYYLQLHDQRDLTLDPNSFSSLILRTRPSMIEYIEERKEEYYRTHQELFERIHQNNEVKIKKKYADPSYRGSKAIEETKVINDPFTSKSEDKTQDDLFMHGLIPLDREARLN